MVLMKFNVNCFFEAEPCKTGPGAVLRVNDVRGDHTIRFELFRGRQNQGRRV